jgi:hypothetical protein
VPEGLWTLHQQKLQRDEPLEGDALSLVDAHIAAAQLLDNAAVRDGLANIGERGLRCNVRDVTR